MVLEVNRFAFLQLDNPEMRKKDIDFCHGPLYGAGGVRAAVNLQQDGRCLLCRKQDIGHYHHIVPRSRRGSNTIQNIAGLCLKCHELVHKDTDAAQKLAAIKAGLKKKHGGTSVLNQIIPFLTRELADLYPGHTYVTNGWSSDDMTGSFDVVVFPDTFEKFASILKEGSRLSIKGKLSIDDAKSSLIAEYIIDLDTAPRTIWIRLKSHGQNLSEVQYIKGICAKPSIGENLLF